MDEGESEGVWLVEEGYGRATDTGGEEAREGGGRGLHRAYETISNHGAYEPIKIIEHINYLKPLSIYDQQLEGRGLTW